MLTSTEYPKAETAGSIEPAAAALGTLGNRDTPPPAECSDQGKRQGRRLSRHHLKVVQRFLTASKSSRLCLYPVVAQVVLGVGRSLVAHVGGVARCGSPWSCPVCAPVVRERRAGEIDTGTRQHLDSGGGVEFVTLTLRHHQADRLEDRLAVVARALHLVLQGAPWQRRRRRLGYLGAIRAVEVTDGANGWHPHCHALLFFDRPLTDEERADLRSWMLGRWGAVVERRGFGTVNDHGVDVRRVTPAGEQGIGSYLAKVDGGWGAGLELARSDVKRGAPTQHLTEFAATGCARALARWREYEAATFGKRAIVWSPGLRARLLGDDTEAADEDLAASEGLDLALVEAVVAGEDWRRCVDVGRTGELLTEVEQCAAWLFVVCEVLGCELQPVNVPRSDSG